MDKFTKITLLFLSAQLFIMGLIVSHLAYKLGFEQGQMQVYHSFADTGDSGTCYVPGGCDNKGGSGDTRKQPVKRHK